MSATSVVLKPLLSASEHDSSNLGQNPNRTSSGTYCAVRAFLRLHKQLIVTFVIVLLKPLIINKAVQHTRRTYMVVVMIMMIKMTMMMHYYC
jgi:hypothetical protein